MVSNFDANFAALTGNSPFPWQVALYERFVAGDFPASCNLPTGLGKTAVIPIWLLALAKSPNLVPRRLVYVVNRRTVVDQASDEAKRTRDRLSALPEVAKALKVLCAVACETPLAISTLRGQLADNAEWRSDPARPAIIIGTVDMIGSRLLFSGYGCGFKSRPLHAGFLGQDSLLVHDEAHLEPAFQELLLSLEKEQCHGRTRDLKPIKVLELTATSRGDKEPFRLTAADHNNSTVNQRFNAVKKIVLHLIQDEKKQLADRITELALVHKDSQQAILVFVRRLEDVQGVVDRLYQAKVPTDAVETLTGTMRGFERDKLAKGSHVFSRFSPDSSAEKRPGTVYLVCTSAGEVGVNISADHLVCDLSTFDSMAQRFGRVNRFGKCDARLDIVFTRDFSDDNPVDARRKLTLSLLESLRGDGSPAALDQLDSRQKQEAFTPEPIILQATDILFDAWALTSIREHLPARPPVADYLHGVPPDWQPAETNVAWREEVDLFERAGISPREIKELLDEYPLKPHELLRDRSDRVAKQIATLAKTQGSRNVWLLERDDELTIRTLAELAEKKELLEDAIVILPPSVGGLSTQGTLDGKSVAADYVDVADEIEIDNIPVRKRLSVNADVDVSPPKGMRLVARISLHPDGDEAIEEPQDSSPAVRLFFVRPRFADDDGSKNAGEVPLTDHLNDVKNVAERIASALCEEKLRDALILAAQFHDLGKDRAVWQRSVGNQNPSTPWAKSGKVKLPVIRTDYRHEFGSLLDLSRQDAFNANAEFQELISHTVAAHHGRGRPDFPISEAFDPNYPEADVERLAAAVPIRYAALQRKYGRWGLAYLESILRAADIEASAHPVEATNGKA